jgi:hypothetical protein
MRHNVFKRTLRAAGLFLFSATLLGCSLRGCSSSREDIPPEEQLHSYIQSAVNVTRPEQRQDLIDLTTGALKAGLVNATEETFKRAYIDKKYDFKEFQIIQRKDAPGGKETQIDFKLVYKAWSAGETAERAPLTETTNRATLVYEHGQWAISKVESLGTNFEWDVGLPMDGVKTEGITPETPPVEVETSRDASEKEQMEMEKSIEEQTREGDKPQ